MKNNFKKQYVQRNKWKNHNRIAICWAFYYINDNQKVDVKVSQTMKCILCYNNIVLESNLKTQARKYLFLQHSKWNNCSKKTCAFKSFKHCKLSLKKGEQSIKIKKKKINVLKKNLIYLELQFLIFLLQRSFQKTNMQQKQLVQYLALLIVKHHSRMHFVERQWLKCFNLH